MIFLALYTDLAPDDKILFLHIPKSAGSTIVYLFTDHFSYQELSGDSPPILFSTRRGVHACFYDEKHLLDEYKFITFLRHPIERILSEQRYCVDLLKRDPKILESHLLSSESDPINSASNIVCKMLSGLNFNDRTITIETHLENAKINLRNNFLFVGIVEQMEESITLLYNSLGWTIPEQVPVRNTTILPPFENADTMLHTQKNQVESREFYPHELIEGIKTRNWADIELYNYAVDLFEQRKTTNTKTNKTEKTQIQFKNRYDYSFEQALNGYGWSSREFTIDYCYRWVSDSNYCTADFFLQKDTYLLDCCIFIQPALAELFCISANNTPIKTNYALNKNEDPNSFQWVHFSSIISKELVEQNKKTQIAFFLTTPINPSIPQYKEMDKSKELLRKHLPIGRFACNKINIAAKGQN